MPRRKKRRGRPSAIARVSTADLMKEMERRRGMLGSLRAMRDDLTRQLESLNAEIAEIESMDVSSAASPRRGPGRPKSSGRGGRGRGRGRGGNEESLSMLLHRLLRGRTMSVPEMAEAARKAGHKSKSKNFPMIVRLAILNNRKMFKRVSRGQYTVK
jgi:hypothetical protein